ncbi:12974_t:CDS:1, partial [Dentiscutata heterogama]
VDTLSQLNEMEKEAMKVYIVIEESEKEELKRKKKEKQAKEKKTNLSTHEVVLKPGI